MSQSDSPTVSGCLNLIVLLSADVSLIVLLSDVSLIVLLSADVSV